MIRKALMDVKGTGKEGLFKSCLRLGSLSAEFRTPHRILV